MITRTAIFEGRVRDGRAEDFFAAVEGRLAPLWQAFPQALAVRFFRVDACDDADRPVAMIQQIDYPSMEAMQAALASPARDAARAVTLELMEMFDGRFYHVITGPDRLAAQG
jgi:hypothetical protein